MTVEELERWVTSHPKEVVPLVGAGLAISAGAPTTEKLAGLLSRRLGLADQPDLHRLTSVTRRGVADFGLPAVRAALADVITGLRLRPTPALTAICAVRSGLVLTTNYDDALERAAVARGLTPVLRAPTDPALLAPAETNHVQIVHLHGTPRCPESLVVPGPTTGALDDDDVFTTFTRAALAPRSIVFLGFSLSEEEVHLLHTLRWLAKVRAASNHFLLLPADEVERRSDELERITQYGNVTVVSYERDERHTAAERVALAFAPRAHRAEDKATVTWVEPWLLRLREGEAGRDTHARARSIEGGWGSPEDAARLRDLLCAERSLIVAGAGYGKTTLVSRVAQTAEGRTVALARLRDFQPSPEPRARELAVLRLLRSSDDEPLGIEVLEEPGAALLLDGLDEVVDTLVEDAIDAIAAALEHWPGHTWIVTSRPGEQVSALQELDFVPYVIPTSRAWARTYLETRSVPTTRVEHALRDGYGLGDLLCIPMFAERIADRLLDHEPDGEIRALDLLVEEQDAAAMREARRLGYRREVLSSWLRSLAVALELSGRVTATTEELADFPASSDPSVVRASLVKATLLADRPGVAEFPSKPLQEGLCADSILKHPDSVNLVRRAAVAQVAGVPTLREDIDVTLDLVFEHASSEQRAALRPLDEQRWARTAARSADEADARDALNVILRFHSDHNLRLGWGAEGGLRHAFQAAADLVRRWPNLLVERTEGLANDLLSECPVNRSRALALLSLGDDPRLVDWTLRALGDDDRRIIEEAARIAERKRILAARDVLFELLESREDRIRAAALSALVEIVDVDELPEVAGRVKGDGLRRVAPRILERVDLDTGMHVASAGYGLGSTQAWMLERLVETAHPDAWSPERVAQLMRCLGGVGGGGSPNIEVLVTALRQHPQVALDQVRLSDVLGAPYGPQSQMLALRAMDLPALGVDPGQRTLDAMTRAVANEKEIDARRNPQDHQRRILAEVLDRDGEDVDPDDLPMIATSKDVEPRHRELLDRLVYRWWPVAPFLTESGDDGLNRTTLKALSLGSTLETPLPAERWEQLLDAHLQADHWPLELSDSRITSWLSAVFRKEFEPVLFTRIDAASDGNRLVRLFVVGRSASDPELTDRVLDRLLALGPDAPEWSAAVRLVIDRHGASAGTRLLSSDMEPASRQVVVGAMARRGDPDAQLEVVRALTEAVCRGEEPDEPTWFKRASVDVAALTALFEASVARGQTQMLSFARGMLSERRDEEAVLALLDLANAHPEHPGLRLQAITVARSAAAARVLARLPERLADVATYLSDANNASTGSCSSGTSDPADRGVPGSY